MKGKKDLIFTTAGNTRKKGSVMKSFEARNLFSNVVADYLSPLGFCVKKKNNGQSASGYIIYEYQYDASVWYELSLSYTSYLAVCPTFSVYYKEVVDIIR